MSARFGVVGVVDAGGDALYFAQLLQVDADYQFDYAALAFASSVLEADAKIPLTQDTRANRENYYRTPTLSTLGEAGWVELTMHRASDGLIVAAPSRYYIRDGSIADPPVKLAADGLDAISGLPASGDPTNFRERLMWDVQRRRNSVLTSTLLITKDDDGDIITQQPVSDNGLAQTMGKPI